jgi:hypothetical protein
MRREDVAVLEMPVELFEQAQCVGGAVDRFRWTRAAIDQPLPPTADEVVVEPL